MDTYTEWGNRIYFRGREVHATAIDAARFVDALSSAFPEARYFTRIHSSHQSYPPIPPEEAVKLFGAGKGFNVVFDPAWEAETGRYDDEDRGYWDDGDRFYLANQPTLMAFFQTGSLDRRFHAEIDRTISISRDAQLSLSFEIGNRDEKKVVDKVLRIHRKQVSNRLEAFDLRTGKPVDTGPRLDWYGFDMGRRSREEEDLYIAVRFDRENDSFWGYKAVD